ncbi:MULTISPECIES: damage-inducible type I toxin DinQ [Photorhabdus]
MVLKVLIALLELIRTFFV